MSQVPYEQISRDILDELSKATANQPYNDLELKDLSAGAMFPKDPRFTAHMKCQWATFTGTATLSLNAPMAMAPLNYGEFIEALAGRIEQAIGPNSQPDRQADVEFSAVVEIPHHNRRTSTTGYVTVSGELKIYTAR